jgi:hypothetical protein
MQAAHRQVNNAMLLWRWLPDQIFTRDLSPMVLQVLMLKAKCPKDIAFSREFHWFSITSLPYSLRGSVAVFTLTNPSRLEYGKA